MKTLSLSLLVILFIACNPCRYVARHQECFLPDTIRETSVQTIHDTTTWIEADSFALNALFYCDSTNNVLIKMLNEYKSKGVVTKIVYKNNTLQISLATDSIAKLNRYISSMKTHVEYVKNPVNAELQRKNLKYEKQLQRKNIWLKITGGSLIVLLILIALFIWSKLK
jgi:hypothetical protein